MKRPQVIVNCAMSADGKIALPTRKQVRISCDEDIKRMHQLRNDCDAVLVGVGNILADDPKLTVKEAYVSRPKQPLRVVLDSKGRIPSNALVLNTVANTLVITAKGKEKRFKGSHIEVAGCSTDNDGFLDVHEVLEMLFKRGVRKLLVEGGGTVIWNFLAHKVVDDVFIYIGPCIIGGAGTPTVADGKGIRNEADIISLRMVEMERLGPGLLVHYQPR
jgi:2,5-diamino-6-(ribosylamino)-4(3H)-pyrimidinone 5'-phosphate reductase